MFGTLLLQCLYCVRYKRVPHPPISNRLVVGHVLRFLGRVSFIFAGALLLSLFFKHIPELDILPDIVEGLARVCLALIVMFAFYCYSLELERLGQAMDRASA